MFRVVIRQRAVALVPFGHEPLALRVPMGVGAEDRDFRADVVRGPHAAHPQDVRRHGGGGRLAVHSADDDPLLALHDGRERVGPPHHAHPLADRLVVFDIAGPDRRRVDDQVRVMNIRGILRLVKFQAQLLEAMHLDGRDLVRAGNRVPHGHQEPGDSAHAGTRHADQVDAEFAPHQNLG